MANDDILEKNRALAHRFHLEIIQEKNLALADEIIAPDCTFHSATTEMEELKGPERAKNSSRYDHEMFPKGVKFVHVIVLAEGDLVAFHWTLTGIRESGETVRAEGLDMVRIRGDKIAEMWIEYHPVRE